MTQTSWSFKDFSSASALEDNTMFVCKLMHKWCACHSAGWLAQRLICFFAAPVWVGHVSRDSGWCKVFTLGSLFDSAQGHFTHTHTHTALALASPELLPTSYVPAHVVVLFWALSSHSSRNQWKMSHCSSFGVLWSSCDVALSMNTRIVDCVP